MTTYPIVRTHMTPGLSNDCGVEGCNGIAGGFCSLLQDDSGLAIKSWCCTPTAHQCWGPRQSNCDVKAAGQSVCTSRAGSSTEWKWCCDARFEVCGTSDGLCALMASPNPASGGPAWESSSTFTTSSSSTTASSSGSASTPTASPSASMSESPSAPHPSNAIIGLGAASIVVLVAIGAGLIYLWRLNRRDAAGRPVEMLTRFLTPEKERCELAGEDVSEVHELDTGTPLPKAE